MKLLIDPRVITPSLESRTRADLTQFWSTIVEWSSDNRVVVGIETFNQVWERFGALGYPEEDLEIYPNALRNEYRKALNRLLSRVVEHHVESGDRSMNPEYLGTENQVFALSRDISGTAGRDICGIASTESSWSEECSEIFFDPMPPQSLAVCVQAGVPLEAEKEKRIRECSFGRRVYVVGGKVSPYVLAILLKKTGFSESGIILIPAEKGKPPRDLDKKLQSLKASRDIVVCITGRIGHAQSERVVTAASKSGAVYLPVETANGIADALISVLSQMGPM